MTIKLKNPSGYETTHETHDTALDYVEEFLDEYDNLKEKQQDYLIKTMAHGKGWKVFGD